MYSETVTITTVGGDGVATGSGATRLIRGIIYKIYLDYHGSAPATTDVTITTVDENSTTLETILTVTNNATDGPYSPMTPAHDSAGAVTGDWVHQDAPNATVNIAVAQCDALTDALVAYVHWYPVSRLPATE